MTERVWKEISEHRSNKSEEDPNGVIANWLEESIPFILNIWERLNNESFKPVDFEGFKTKAGKTPLLFPRRNG